jgi:hypothetical protein
MQRPEVRIVEPQFEETKSIDVSQSEKDYLLSKYGYKIEQPNYNNSYSNMTFEELMKVSENKEKEERLRREENKNRPLPFTFDPNRVGYSESKFSSLDLDGQNLGIRVNIVSDFPINK